MPSEMPAQNPGLNFLSSGIPPVKLTLLFLSPPRHLARLNPPLSPSEIFAADTGKCEKRQIEQTIIVTHLDFIEESFLLF